MKPRRPPTSRPVTLEPTASVKAFGVPRLACSFSISGLITSAKLSAFAWIQPVRSTTSTGAVRSCATSPVNSRTRPVDRFASSRSSATTASASGRVITGPGPAIREAAATARSQSIIVRAPKVPDMPSTLRGGRTGAGRQRCSDLVQQVPGSQGVAAPYSVGDGHEAHYRAVAGAHRPRQAVHPGERPGLRPDDAQAGAAGREPVVERPGEAGDGQRGHHRTEPGMARPGGGVEHRQQRLGADPVVAGQAAAVVQAGAGGVDADVVEYAEDRPNGTREGRGLPLGEGDLAGQHLGALVIADLEDVLHDL